MIEYYALKNFPTNEFDDFICQNDLNAVFATNPSFETIVLIYIPKDKNILAVSPNSLDYLIQKHAEDKVKVYDYSKNELKQFLKDVKLDND